MSHNWSHIDTDKISWQCKHCAWNIKIRDGRHPLQSEDVVKRYPSKDAVGRLPLLPEFKQFHDDNGNWQDCTNTDSQLLYLKIDNFKSLVDFSLPLAKFNCLIGLNGAGKTTLLQALDFMSQVMAGQVKLWLRERDWTASDLNCRMSAL